MDTSTVVRNTYKHKKQTWKVLLSSMALFMTVNLVSESQTVETV